MLKIGQNWGKIANYPPQYSTKICTPGYRPSGLPTIIILVLHFKMAAKLRTQALYQTSIFITHPKWLLL